MFPPTFVWVKKIARCSTWGTIKNCYEKSFKSILNFTDQTLIQCDKFEPASKRQVVLKYKETSLLHMLEGWMQRKSLCPSIASLRSFHETKESKKVSVIQKISNQWTFKNAEICESFTQTLFKFQWQTDKELVHPPCPGLASIFHDCMMMHQP